MALSLLRIDFTAISLCVMCVVPTCTTPCPEASLRASEESFPSWTLGQNRKSVFSLRKPVFG